MGIFDKLLPRKPSSTTSARHLPVVRKSTPLPARMQAQGPAGKLPNASVIYGIGASVLFVLAVFFLFKGILLTGALLIILAGCLAGYALHFLRYQE
jgi:hypothetical protein